MSSADKPESIEEAATKSAASGIDSGPSCASIDRPPQIRGQEPLAKGERLRSAGMLLERLARLDEMPLGFLRLAHVREARREHEDRHRLLWRQEIRPPRRFERRLAETRLVRD